ncbi:MAG: DNA polymerase III subunit alpha [Planctomycetes bacterium]|nr:DNA polymerase III subunit alpha [Planctomycetota bacterium]
MSGNEFVHLHVHTHFSLLDGNCQLDHLLDTTKAAGMDALALTDHGNLFGAVPFYKAAKQRGIKPILGMEAYIAEGSRLEKKRIETEDGHRKNTYHTTLLARNEEGFSNLVQLASTAYVEGYWYKPRIDRASMREFGRGLICLSGCLAGEVNRRVLAGRMEEAEKVIREYQDIFGAENFYLEVMNHGLDLEDKARAGLKELAAVTGARLVATNDIHYVRAEDWKAQDIALCIGTNTKELSQDRFRMSTHELYFKDSAAMAALFTDMPEALSATREIADRCNFDIKLGQRHLPSFSAPAGDTPETLFRRLCAEGVRRLYPEITPAIQARLDYEMDTIGKMGFIDYFLIVWDFIRYAHEQNIAVGPGRGSAAGSLVSYALNITRIDPLRYDLIFERFLNSERVSMPDIDIDFCKDRRAEVLAYVQQKYGRERVAQIITFGTLKTRGLIRDVGRALDLPLPIVERIAAKVPSGPKDSLAEALQKDPEVQALRAESEVNQRLFDLALKLEGSARNASVHAAGVVISDRPLRERVPLYRAKDDNITTQWTMDVLEDIGLLKMDFLGLRTLTILEEAVSNVRRSKGIELDPDRLPLDDARTYRMLSQGKAVGVFQLESEGMLSLLQRVKPDRFEDLIALLALYRPGPLEAGMVDLYVARKNGTEPVGSLHPSLAGILADSLGVILYQEQVMRIANTLAGFSMNEADNLRKAMGKKKPEILAKFKQRFVDGSQANGVAAAQAADIFDKIEKFAGYGFNKSHSAAYALVTWQTAWFKCNHPLEFMAALLSCEMVDLDKTVEYVEECRSMGIVVLPPDAGRSGPRFRVEGQGLRYALAALKGVGEVAAGAIAAAAEKGAAFTSLHDLCERIDTRLVNRTVLQALVDAGALDSLPGNRAQKSAVLEEALAVGNAAERDRRSGQFSLFGTEVSEPAAQAAATISLPQIPDFSEQERLQREKGVLGFYLTGHPLNRVRKELSAFASAKIEDLARMEDGARTVLGGIVQSVTVRVIKSGKNAGQKMAVVLLEDMSGQLECLIFSDHYLRLIDKVVVDRIVFLEGTVDRRRETPSLRIQEVHPLETAPLALAKRLTLNLESDENLDMVIAAVHQVLRDNRGKLPVFFALTTPAGRVTIQAGDNFRVAASAKLVESLGRVLRPEHVALW